MPVSGRPMADRIKDYLAAIGKKGGEAGTGKAKRRTRKQYREMAAKSAEARRAKRKRAAVSASATPDRENANER